MLRESRITAICNQKGGVGKTLSEVLIPTQAHYLSIKGMEQLIRTISNVKRKINPGLEIAGVHITMADMRTNYSREIIGLLRSIYGSKKKQLIFRNRKELEVVEYEP